MSVRPPTYLTGNIPIIVEWDITDTQKIYHLDSHFKEEALEERRFTIRNIVRLRVYILSLITKPFIF